MGQNLTSDLTKKAKKERLIKSYVPEAMIAAAGLYGVTVISSEYNGLISGMNMKLNAITKISKTKNE